MNDNKISLSVKLRLCVITLRGGSSSLFVCSRGFNSYNSFRDLRLSIFFSTLSYPTSIFTAKPYLELTTFLPGINTCYN